MDLKAMAEQLRDTQYTEPSALMVDAMAFDRALVLDMMQTPAYRPFKGELFTALRTITEWQRGDDRTWAAFMQADSTVSQVIESVRSRVVGKAAA
jgi:hypothetical protein